jgi:hypothetical protein
MDINEVTSNLDLLRTVITTVTEEPLTEFTKTTRCPFHNDKNPSMNTFKSKNGKARFYCHSCHEQGDVIDFLCKLYQWSFHRAVSYIEEILGGHIDRAGSARPFSIPSGAGRGAPSAGDKRLSHLYEVEGVLMPKYSHDCVTRCKHFTDFWDYLDYTLVENRLLRQRLTDLGQIVPSHSYD